MLNKIKTLTIVLIGLIFVINISSAQTWVNGYYKSNGTYVTGHYRTNPDGNPYNNYSYPGNYNPNTGKVSTGNPSTYLRNYYSTPSQSSIYGTSSYPKTTYDLYKSTSTLYNSSSSNSSSLYDSIWD